MFCMAVILSFLHVEVIYTIHASSFLGSSQGSLPSDNSSFEVHVSNSVLAIHQRFWGFWSPKKGRKVTIFGQIWSNFGLKKILFFCYTLLHLCIRRLKWLLSSCIVQLRFREISPNILLESISPDRKHQ